MEVNKYIKQIVPDITDTELDSLYQYFNILVEESQKMNLTSITELEDVYIKHFYDSILIKNSIDLKNKRLVDVGTGAGFPGLVLKIIEPSLEVILVEPTTKRCNFLQKVIDTLKLDKIEIINDRAENCVKLIREKNDIVTARAVSNLSILLELLTPFAKVSGYIVPMKGSDISTELENAKNAINVLHLNLEKIDNYSLPLDKGERNILVFSKTQKTSTIYPRHYSKIKKQPL